MARQAPKPPPAAEAAGDAPEESACDRVDCSTSWCGFPVPRTRRSIDEEKLVGVEQQPAGVGQAVLARRRRSGRRARPVAAVAPSARRRRPRSAAPGRRSIASSRPANSCDCRTMNRSLSRASAWSAVIVVAANRRVEVRVGAVEAFEERVRHAPDDEAIDGPAAHPGIVDPSGVGVVVDRRVVVLERESSKPGPAHAAIERAGDRQDAVAHAPRRRAGGGSSARGSGCRRRSRRRPGRRATTGDRPRCMTISRCKCLERLAAVAELDGQPVEQLGMRRPGRRCGRSRWACRRSRGRSDSARGGWRSIAR